jgi:hypothetical protein
MSEDSLRTRQQTSDQSIARTEDRTDKNNQDGIMLIKHHQTNSKNDDKLVYEQKLSTTVRNIMDTQFSRIFAWEFYFSMFRTCFKYETIHLFLGYIFWSIFFGIGPMVMFFPMVQLSIHGYELLILSMASPIILVSSSINSFVTVCIE